MKINSEVPDNWYEYFFSGTNCEMWEKAMPEEMTAREVDFLVDILNIQNGAEILDVPCGFGRLTVPLAKKGFQVTGIDISSQFIISLDKKVREENLPVRIKQGNILSLEFTGSYDGAFCMGNSFGYFDFGGMNVFVKKVAASLKPNAGFIIQSGMVAESILPRIPPEKTYVLEDLEMKVNNEYVANGSYMISHLTYTKNNHSEQHRYKHYVYTMGEIERLLWKYSLEIVSLYNGFEKNIYQAGDPQVFIVCRKIT